MLGWGGSCRGAELSNSPCCWCCWAIVLISFSYFVCFLVLAPGPTYPSFCFLSWLSCSAVSNLSYQLLHSSPSIY
ncbi:uncharacterized protein ASCRUDRAFT_134816 [Ascoidea rubescens DSM 1968]|uniref:Uncharacterized protein n=1 Tax=Ascoidea rubescens DSM 1968 TaxID=1344418 RepID=A0A1D2VLA3_9ASCO|nr:hypothetical protein ASCRUDRAFT_134816 [Ascoidea rubescens DSM 1968]ODV62410.1 hypothetical protein ASCRUDRAFT_134816 [Ascoidea rubescens DSM 1968]